MKNTLLLLTALASSACTTAAPTDPPRSAHATSECRIRFAVEEGTTRSDVPEQACSRASRLVIASRDRAPASYLVVLDVDDADDDAYVLRTKVAKFTPELDLASADGQIFSEVFTPPGSTPPPSAPAKTFRVRRGEWTELEAGRWPDGRPFRVLARLG